LRYHEDGCNVHPVNYAEDVKLSRQRKTAPEAKEAVVNLLPQTAILGIQLPNLG